MAVGIVIVKDKEVLAIPNLLRYVLKFIYDFKSMTNEEIHKMQDSFIIWNEAIQLQREYLAQIQAADIRTFGKPITTDHKYSEEELQIQNMAQMIQDNAAGKLEARKETFRKHGIDYRKFFRLPEAYTPEDFARGQRALDEAKTAYPEEYKNERKSR